MKEALDALREVERLKTITRDQDVNGRPESTAEHSWSAAVLVDILIDYCTQPLDREKAVMIALYHDLVKVYADDTAWTDEKGQQGKDEREQAAFERIKTLLPRSERYEQFYQEYHNKSSQEAEFVKACEIFESLINRLNEPHTAKEEAYGEAVLEKWTRRHAEKFPCLNEFFDLLLDELRKQEKI